MNDVLEEILKELEIRAPDCWSGIGRGWAPIVKEALQALIELGWDKRLAQVKEKFGGLRIYLHESTLDMDEVVNAACAKALKTCYECGAEAKTQSLSGWYITLCPACREKLLAERNTR